MSDMGLYIVLAFAAAHFIALFNWSNLGSIVAISGASGLQAIGFTGLPLVIGFVIVTGFVNLFVGSASRSRSEEHTSELQSRGHLVCRLLLEKKKTKLTRTQRTTRS